MYLLISAKYMALRDGIKYMGRCNKIEFELNVIQKVLTQSGKRLLSMHP